MRSLARLIRFATVPSGTRNPAATCAVVRPPTARKVRASWDGGDSAGWQHRNNSVSVSSGGASPTGVAVARSSAAATSRRRRALSARQPSISARPATVVSQVRGHCGTPSLGHCRDAASSASCTASSHASNWP
jgi:hypothetical protein